MQFVFILNNTDNAKVFEDALNAIKSKYSASNIYEVPMTKNNDDMKGMDDIWEKYIDLDENMFMNENPLEAKLVRGRSFSIEDRSKLKS